MRQSPVICGPTAGGKSALALALAGVVPAEIVTADAFQVYVGMDIGTAKPSRAERDAVPHHLVDLVQPTERFTVHDWLGRAARAIEDVRARAREPIVVGGTHLYVKALVSGLFDAPGADERVRVELGEMPGPALRAELERVDPPAAARIHPADRRRTLRAVEVFRQTGRPISEWQAQWDDPARSRTDLFLVELDWPVDAINARINGRVRSMIERGLVDEAHALWKEGRLGPQARGAIGYRQLVDHFEGRRTLPEAVERIKIETRRLAKQQRSWLRRLRSTPGAIRLDGRRDPEALAREILDAPGATERRSNT